MGRQEGTRGFSKAGRVSPLSGGDREGEKNQEIKREPCDS